MIIIIIIISIIIILIIMLAKSRWVVKSGIRTHAYKSRLRPERSALDRSAILTCTWPEAKSFVINESHFAKLWTFLSTDNVIGSCILAGEALARGRNYVRKTI